VTGSDGFSASREIGAVVRRHADFQRRRGTRPGAVDVWAAEPRHAARDRRRTARIGRHPRSVDNGRYAAIAATGPSDAAGARLRRTRQCGEARRHCQGSIERGLQGSASPGVGVRPVRLLVIECVAPCDPWLIRGAKRRPPYQVTNEQPHRRDKRQDRARSPEIAFFESVSFEQGDKHPTMSTSAALLSRACWIKNVGPLPRSRRWTPVHRPRYESVLAGRSDALPEAELSQARRSLQRGSPLQRLYEDGTLKGARSAPGA